MICLLIGLNLEPWANGVNLVSVVECVELGTELDHCEWMIMRLYELIAHALDIRLSDC